MTTTKVTNSNWQTLESMNSGDPFMFMTCPSQNLVGTAGVKSTTEVGVVIGIDAKGTYKIDSIPGTMVEKLPAGSEIKMTIS